MDYFSHFESSWKIVLSMNVTNFFEDTQIKINIVPCYDLLSSCRCFLLGFESVKIQKRFLFTTQLGTLLLFYSVPVRFELKRFQRGQQNVFCYQIVFQWGKVYSGTSCYKWWWYVVTTLCVIAIRVLFNKFYHVGFSLTVLQKMTITHWTLNAFK